MSSDASIPALDWLLTRAARAADAPVDPQRLRSATIQATTEHPEATEQLAQAAADIGLSVTRLPLRVIDALPLVGPRTPLAVHTTYGWWFLEDRRRGGALVRRSDDADPVWMTVPTLQAALGDDVVPFWSLEAARPFESHHGEHHHGPSPARRLWEILRTERTDLAVLSVYAAFVGALSLTIPVATQALVNTVAFGTMLQPILVLSGVLFVALGFWAVINSIEVWVVEILQRRLFVRVVADLVHRLPRVTHAVGRELPELVNRFFDVLTVQKSLSTLLLDGLSLALTTAIGMTLLAIYHPIFLGFDLALFAAMAFVLFALGRGAEATSIEESKAKYAIAAWLDEIARHPLAFKADGGPPLAAERADLLAHRYLEARGRHFRVVLRQVASFYGLYALASALLFAIGGWMVLERQLTLGQLVAAELIVSTILGGFSKLGKQLEAFYDLLAAMDKLGHLTDLPLEREGGETPARPPIPARLNVRGVTLARREGLPPIPPLDLDIAPGARVAITGPPGSGKTELIRSLYGATPPLAGAVALDGVDLRDLRLTALRRDLALIGGVELIEGSVLDNITFGRREVTPTHARVALARVGLQEIVRDLPHGLKTPIATDGAPLSHGQAVRLMLARALATRPRAVLLDGALDPLTNDDLQPAIEALFTDDRDITVVLVTHRESLLHDADQRVSLAAEATR